MSWGDFFNLTGWGFMGLKGVKNGSKWQKLPKLGVIQDFLQNSTLDFSNFLPEVVHLYGLQNLHRGFRGILFTGELWT